MIVLAPREADIKAVLSKRRMTAMKNVFFRRLLAALADDARETSAGAAPDWRHDPLQHPAIQSMSLRELADLPLSCLGRPADRVGGFRP